MISSTMFGDLPAIRITAPDGAEATVTLYGAHLVSWKTPDGKERLFVSTCSPLDGSAAIRGGVPVIFPQFSTRGDGQRHGVARLSHWRQGEQGSDMGGTYAEFELSQADVPAHLAAAWPHDFALRLRFTLQGNALQMRFNVRNTGAGDFDFASALHTYYAAGDFLKTSLHGLEQGPIEFGPPLDNIYAAGGELELRTADSTLQLQQQGFTEWVVWNPGAENAARLTDMADQEWREFLCIEPARVDKKELKAGAEWTGEHTITVVG
ncbi:D-hexose-6-phosphate mutarotase [Massilia sp. Root418]|jgi:glucose-6-phosphate 1-epimerase|uniref:D-hexose-6-phosphate mutarotase n=1 Tax=Massilia sp. Root418 TaxID=1736532 RepID=UPI0006FAD221|nr:D-hexose-6-phosphate mutarotase [Massilia sp. Root418]KQW96475.1 D-hexose-6-phosphate mutarotase [Massilia sp. Root418]